MPEKPFRIAVLSRSPKIYSTRRILEAARARGHTAKVLDTLKFGLYVESKSPDMTYRGKPVAEFDAVIPRIGSSISFFGTAVVRQFEQMGLFTLNQSNGIAVARDKLRSMQVLSRHDIGIAQSAFVREKGDILQAIEHVGGGPVIIKLLEGTQGVGVILAETAKMAETVIETLQSTQQNVLLQKFVSESKGKDIRAFVIGDRVVGAMRRRAQGNEFRSNVHRGGSVETVELDPEYERTAVRAAKIIGLRVAGVDMLEGREGPVIMEVNASPGLEGIEAATGRDIAGEIVDYLIEHTRYGDLDLRQRLAFARGYVVADFGIRANSPLIGKSLAECGLRERDIIVMDINRNGQHIPAPKGDDTILEGDVLLCYGPRLALREVLPALVRPQRRRAAPKAKKKAAAPRKKKPDEGDRA
ncbi:MAG: RimK family alpha-L-glutamate ligase [Opitutales bacterium]